MSDKKTLLLSYGLNFLAIALSINNSIVSYLIFIAAAALLVRFTDRTRPVNIPAHIILALVSTIVFVLSIRSMISISVMFLVISGLNVLFSQLYLYAFYQTRKPVRRRTSFLTTIIFLALVFLMLLADLSIKLLMGSTEYGVLTSFWQMALIIGTLNAVMLVMPKPVTAPKSSIDLQVNCQ